MYGGVEVKEYSKLKARHIGLNKDVADTRKSFGLTQEEMAEVLKCSVGKIQNIESGERELKFTEYRKIMETLSIHLAKKQGIILDDHFTIENMKSRVIKIISSMFGSD